MVNTNKLRGLMVEKGFTFVKVAEELGITERTLSTKMKNGDFSINQAKALISLLGIENPVDIFLS